MGDSKENKRQRAIGGHFKAIRKKIDLMMEEFGEDIEMAFFVSVTDNQNKHEFGFEGISINNDRSYGLFVKLLLEYQRHQHEIRRFGDFNRLGKFRVICSNDVIKPDVAKHFNINKGDWIEKGKEYIVINVRESISGLCFELTDTDGKELKASYPFEGYHSSRFIPVDYTKLN